MQYTAKDEEKLMAKIWSPELKEDPLAFVMFAFPWGQPNTPLANKTGPRTWQRDELLKIKEHIQVQKNRIAIGLEPEVYKLAVASGRGIGKSAFFAMLTLWLMSVQPGITIVVSANNESQLKDKTWAELGKWHAMAINEHWFEKLAMSLKPAPWFEAALKKDLKLDTGYYYANAQLWSEENPDAFAGAHNENGIAVFFDEASGIPKVIFGVTDGFFTEPVLYRFWICFSNPRRNTGHFFELFHKLRKWWRSRNIDSRDVEGTDKKVLNDIIEANGIDSDEARVEVLGQFPKQGSKQFISSGVIEAAATRPLQKDPWAPLLMAVDVARYGEDSTVIRFRQGRDARSIPPTELIGKDNMEVANEVAFQIDEKRPDAVFIGSGAGQGVIDRLKERGYRIIEVQEGGKSRKKQFLNKRTDMWDDLREWLDKGCIPDHQQTKDDLGGPEKKFAEGGDKIRLETKEEMASRGLSSPDWADPLAFTFAERVAGPDHRARRSSMRNKVAPGTGGNVFS